MDRRLPRDDAVLHQQHPAEGRRHASRRVPRGPDAHRQQHRQRDRHRQEGKDRADRRRRARGPDLRAVGQGARPEILLADQGQAGLVRGPADRRAGGRRQADAVVRGASGRCQARRHQGGRGRHRARGGAQGARADPPQGRARHGLPARQARRLPGARPREIRAVHRRGRQRRRLGQAGPQPRLPGDPADPRQDPERRARALRQDAVLGRDRHPDRRDRHRHRRRGFRRRQGALPQDHHHGRRRCRRLAYPHAAAHVLLPADAAADRRRATSTSRSRRSTAPSAATRRST